MGVLEDFFRWVRKSDNYNKLNYNLELINRNLVYQRKKLEKESKAQFKRAKKYRLEGNNQGARLYMQHRLRFQKWAIAVDTYRLNIEGLIHQIKMAKSHVEIARNLSSVQRSLKSLLKNVEIPKLGEMMSDLQQNLQQFDLTGEYIQDGVEEGTQTSLQVTEYDIKDGMEQLDAEIEAEAKKSLLPPSEKMIELEKEIKKLKEEKL
ncbi:MAG: Snf7 family protein [Candidatus Helarchaeota archaeon]|nr:Snf7 family protein [Candidatus Helarchaeota archaeon]